jgi:uncharacterized damage-inducible protein DinB
VSGKDELLHYVDRVRGRTRRVAALIPPDRVEWTHTPGTMTLGDLVRHLGATERGMWAETVAGRPSRYTSHGRELADGLDQVLAYLDQMHAESMAIFRALSDEALAGLCRTPAGATMPVWKWLRAMIEHEAHHRGQIYLMLSMLSVPTPPLYGVTSEELRAAAVRPVY